MSTFDVEAAIQAFRFFPGRSPEAPAALRAKVASELARLGLRIDGGAVPSGSPGALLLAASRNTGTVSAYEIPAAPDAITARMIAAVSGCTFGELQDLEPSARGDAARFLIATRLTGLSPEELADWVAGADADECPDSDELERLDNHLGATFRGEVTHGSQGAELDAVGTFDRVHVVVYDGD